MEDKNLVNKPVKVEQIIAAVRCFANPSMWLESDCNDCPFWETRTLTPEEQKRYGVPSWKYCNTIKVCTMAADRLANDQSHIAALQKEIEKLRSGRRWIPVTERLPEKWIDEDTRELVNYLVYGPDIGVDIGNYFATADRWNCIYLPVNVTHWMPLPEPPEVE